MSKLVYVPPPVYALLIVGLCRGLTIWLPVPVDVSAPWLGAFLALLALILMIWAWWGFARRGTTPVPTGSPSALVATGPYRWTRNPMYLGVILALAAVPFFTGSLWDWLAPPVFWYIVNTLFIPYEEAKLGELFGDDYQAFCARVRRWL